MKKILTLFKTIILISSLAVLPIGCSKTQDHKGNVDISHINILSKSVSVNLSHDIYDNVLINFKKQIFKKISKLVSSEQKPQYGRDYKIVIANHNLYSKIEQYGLIDIVVKASITTHILRGQFVTQINLVKTRQDISHINIANQNYANTVIGTTTFKDIIVFILPLIQTKINDIDNSAKQNIDYVVNVEGYELLAIITNLDDVNINVNAINDQFHFLLTGNFTFLLTIS